MIRNNIFLVLLICALFLISSCTTGEVVKEEVIKIGVVLPLTGTAANYGIDTKKGIDLALEEINKEGVNGKKLELIYEDDKCQSKESLSVFEKLIHIDGVKVIVGHVCSASAMAAAPLAEQNRVVVISPGASTPDLKYAGDYVFRTRQSISKESETLAELAYDLLNMRRIAIIHINDDYGLGAKKVIEKRFEELGGEIIAIENYEKSSTDFRTQLTKVKALNPEAIIIVTFIEDGANLAKQARELGITTQILSTIGIESPDTIEIAGDTVEGIIYVRPAFDVKSEDPTIKEFVNNFRKKYDSDPLFVFSANGYDALKLAASAIEKCGYDSECIKEELYKVKNYPGVGGLITFDEYGEVNKPMIVMTIRNGEFVMYEDGTK